MSQSVWDDDCELAEESDELGEEEVEEFAEEDEHRSSTATPPSADASVPDPLPSTPSVSPERLMPPIEAVPHVIREKTEPFQRMPQRGVPIFDFLCVPRTTEKRERQPYDSGDENIRTAAILSRFKLELPTDKFDRQLELMNL